MRASLLCISIVVLAAGCTTSDSAATAEETGQLGWPTITRQSKPWTRWWWPASAADTTDIDAMLDEYAAAGLGGMEVTTIYGAKGYEAKYRKYLSPEWMDLFTHTLDAADKRDLGIDLANASGWPFGGNWVTDDYSCRYLASKTYEVKGGESIKDTIKFIQKPIVKTLGKRMDISRLKYPITANDSLQQYAFDQVRYPVELPLIAVTANSADGGFEDLTGKVRKDGTLEWTAPQGDWTVCALFLGWHGKMVERAGPGGEGNVIDHFSKQSTSRYLAEFDKAFKGYDVGKIRCYFNDSYEVDDASGQSDWTPDFFAQFLKRRGYDLKQYMPELLGLSIDKEKSDRVVFDYRTTIGELLAENYLQTWHDWAAAQGKGIRNQAHGSPANILDLYALSDIPETEGSSIIGMKTASSAAHVTGKPLISSESATWLGEHFQSTLGDVKTSMDTYFLSGVNHIFYHGTCLSPGEVPWPGWLFYAAVHFQPTNSFWTDFAAFNRYVAHCQTFLQAGKPDNDILLFFDATDLFSERGREKMLYHTNQNTPKMSSIGKSAEYLYGKGYTWDYITDKMITDDIHVSDGKLVTADGNAYGTIIIPQCNKMMLGTLRKLVDLAKKGATILVEGSLPDDVPGLANLDENRAALRKLTSSLEFSDNAGISTAKCGKGRFIVSSDLDAMLSSAGISRETMYDLGLQCISRVKPDGGRYYFIRNAGKNTVRGMIPIDIECGTVGIYNPMTDKFGYGDTGAADGKTTVYMEILPDQSFLLETFKGAYQGDKYVFYDTEDGVATTTLAGPWTVTFTKGGPELPAEKTVSALGTWTSYGKPYEIFSGTARYETPLAPQTGAADAWILNLGDVRHSASVSLDGEYLGTLFKEPYTIVLTAEQATRGGKLVIDVSNSMENRIRYMDRNGIPWKTLYNANIQARLREDRGPDGFFTAAGWSVQDSGLMGPVTIAPLKASVPTTNN